MHNGVLPTMLRLLRSKVTGPVRSLQVKFQWCLRCVTVRHAASVGRLGRLRSELASKTLLLNIPGYHDVESINTVIVLGSAVHDKHLLHTIHTRMPRGIDTVHPATGCFLHVACS